MTLTLPGLIGGSGGLAGGSCASINYPKNPSYVLGFIGMLTIIVGILMLTGVIQFADDTQRTLGGTIVLALGSVVCIVAVWLAFATFVPEKQNFVLYSNGDVKVKMPTPACAGSGCPPAVQGGSRRRPW